MYTNLEVVYSSEVSDLCQFAHRFGLIYGLVKG